MRDWRNVSMSPTLIALLVTLAMLAAWLVLRALRPRLPAEPQDESEVLASIGRGPRSNAGAVALEGPDDASPRDLIGRKS